MPAVPALTKINRHLNLSQRQAQRAAVLLRLLFTDTAQRTAPESWAGARIGAASVLLGSVNKSNAACWFYCYSPYLYCVTLRGYCAPIIAGNTCLFMVIIVNFDDFYLLTLK